MAIQAIDPRRAEKMVGSPIERREDPALVTGEAQYTDDMNPPGTLHMAVLRSQYAHATINGIDTSAAEAMDGVVAVYTWADVEASDSPGEIQPLWMLPDLKTPPHRMLASDKVRYQGEPVAVAIAEDRYLARDAAEKLE